MKNKKPVPEPAPFDPGKISGVFYTVGKESHLLYEAFAIEVKDGIVVSLTRLSRAPDLASTAVGNCAAGLWRNLRTQKTLACSG